MSVAPFCYSCPFCFVQKFDLNKYLQHVQLCHEFEANFRISCGIGGCVANYKRVKYLRDHINAVHKNIIAINNVSSSCENLENDSINDDYNMDDAEEPNNNC